MEYSSLKINNKIKQKVAGNWGHPSKDEKHERITELDETLHKTVPIHKHKKKKKKPYVYSYKTCPFCKKELPLDEKKIKEEKTRCKEGLYIWEDMYRVDACSECKSFEVKECPACKYKTWFHPITRKYKHKSMGCGFEGIKK
jgi:hypothetical protein